MIECSATTVEPFLKDTPEIRTLFIKDTLLCPKLVVYSVSQLNCLCFYSQFSVSVNLNNTIP